MQLYSVSAGTVYSFGSPIAGGVYNSTGAIGTTGYGPTSAQLQTYYNTNSATLASLLTSGTYFSVPYNGYQKWTVPSTGTYTIEAHGGPGGSTSAVGRSGCKLVGTFSLTQGDILWISVGQAGSTGNAGAGDLCSAGGGGASVVALGTTTATATCLMMAAGGVGCKEARHGPSTPTASSSANGTTGGGFTSWQAQTFNGGYGGYGGQYGTGGFGGGTASDDDVGFAGGYDALYTSAPNSFVAATATNVTRTDIGTVTPGNPGYVTITAVAVALPDPGLYPANASVKWGSTLRYDLITSNVANGTNVTYTLSGVTSAQINNAPLTGNITISNNSGNFSVVTSAGYLTVATLVATANGYTANSVSIIPNISISANIVSLSTQESTSYQANPISGQMNVFDSIVTNAAAGFATCNPIPAGNYASAPVVSYSTMTTTIAGPLNIGIIKIFGELPQKEYWF